MLTPTVGSLRFQLNQDDELFRLCQLGLFFHLTKLARAMLWIQPPIGILACHGDNVGALCDH
jgi:hypothetical protein